MPPLPWEPVKAKGPPLCAWTRPPFPPQRGLSDCRDLQVWRGRLPAVGSACAGSFAQCLLFAPAEAKPLNARAWSHRTSLHARAASRCGVQALECELLLAHAFF